MLIASKPNFAEVVRTAQKLEPAWSGGFDCNVAANISRVFLYYAITERKVR
jgi:hypothetical protein